MISVVLYGRNDAYGYNLHKRAALSINCISQVLTNDEDELLFVDYNTPDDYPTFPEAIQDTLTDLAKKRLRILRVRPWMHERFRGRSHLLALEPVARNVAVRRSNAANRWILSTNTDMIFVPHQGQSLSTYLGDLPRGLYHLPRFEIPETFWELFPRQQPEYTIDAIREWACIAHLNEIVEAADFVRFDGPGDFQLMERADLFTIQGFHEGMLLGWHVDSNIAKRFHLLYGQTNDLLDRLYGYHCDHTRQVTPAHRANGAANDSTAYVDDVTSPYVHEQSESWGLAGVDVEEVRLNHGRDRAYMTGIREVLRKPQSSPTRVGYVTSTYDKLSYTAAHVLPFLADIFVNASPRTSIGWVGSSPELFKMFSAVLRKIDAQSRLVVFEPSPDGDGHGLSGDHVRSLDELDAAVDAVIFDYNAAAAVGKPSQERAVLEGIQAAFFEMVELERRRLDRQELPRRFVVVNAIHNSFESITNQLLHTARTPFSSRIRQGFVVKEADAWFDSMRVGDAGMKQDGVIRASAAKQGLVMFGPYLPLRAGRFRVSIELKCQTTNWRPRLDNLLNGHVKIKVVLGDDVVATRRLSRRELYTDRIDIEFMCPKISLLEVRLWSGGGNDFEIRNLVTCRIE